MKGDNILLTRIDNRLVHGQVGVTWTQTLNANLIVVADDVVAEDELQKSLMTVTAKSSNVGIRFFTIQKTAVCSSSPKKTIEKALKDCEILGLDEQTAVFILCSFKNTKISFTDAR